MKRKFFKHCFFYINTVNQFKNFLKIENFLKLKNFSEALLKILLILLFIREQSIGIFNIEYKTNSDDSV